MDNLLTPHQAVEVVLLASHLDYDESGIFENAQISLTVETSETYYEAVKDGKIGRTKVTVVAQLIRESGLAAPLLSLRVVAGAHIAESIVLNTSLNRNE